MKRFLRLFLVVLATLPLLAHAQLIERLDVSRGEGAMEMTIRFNATVQYVRHAPAEEGRFLRLYLRVTDPRFVELGTIENMSVPKGSVLAPTQVTYPESLSAVPRAMLVTFAKSTRFIVEQGDDGRSIRIYLPLPGEKQPRLAAPSAKPIVPAPVVPVEVQAEPARVVAESSPDAPEKAEAGVMTAEQVEQRAAAFMAEAREAFAAKDYQRATARLYRILSLPGNSQSQAAQGLVGKVRDAAGEYSKARGEYELYLKLYPTGKDAEEIKARLAAMPKADQAPRARLRVRPEEVATWQVYGGVSSSYYTGRSSFDGGQSTRDQSSMVTSFNLNARYRDGAVDNRMVYRDTHNKNFLRPSRDYDRIYSAYVERTDRDVGYFVRAGRQNPNGSGVMERFTGLTGNYNLGEDWKVGGVYGTAVEFNVPYQRTFHGLNLEYIAQAGRPGVNTYFIEQEVDHLMSRRAVGTEIRYFDGSFNAYGMYDYDLLYKAANMMMFQANAMDASGGSYYATADRRRTPPLGLTAGMALFGQDSVAGVAALPQHYRLIEQGSPNSTMYGLGTTRPITDQWQMGLDVRRSSVGGANAQIPLSQICADPDEPSIEATRTCRAPNTGVIVDLNRMCNLLDTNTKTCAASQAASGVTNSYTVQAIGSNLFSPGAVGVANASYTKGPTYVGQGISLSYIYPFLEVWRLESNWRYYTQRDETGQTQDRTSPSVKLAYQWRSSVFLESEVGRDTGKTTNADSTINTSRRDYLYMGVRYDFR